MNFQYCLFSIIYLCNQKHDFKGKSCSILDFVDGTSSDPTASIVCQVPSNNNTVFTEYVGNRGITLIIDNVYSANLQNVVPSNTAAYSEINMISYQATRTGNYTIWLKGFLAPGKTSRYEFEVVSNGNAILFISTDSSSANKVNDSIIDIFQNVFPE